MVMGDFIPIRPTPPSLAGGRVVLEKEMPGPERRQENFSTIKVDLGDYSSLKPVSPVPELELLTVDTDVSRVPGVEAQIGESFCP